MRDSLVLVIVNGVEAIARQIRETEVTYVSDHKLGITPK